MVKKTLSIVVNARLNSTRCPKKHIRNLAGTTLIDECLKKVETLNNVEKKYLATGDTELVDKLKNYSDIENLPRRKESYAKGQVPFHIAFEHYSRVESDYIMIINPCQPLVDKDIYQQAIDWFVDSDSEGAVSVCRERNYFFFEDGKIANFDSSSRLCSVSGPSMFKCTHTFMIFKKSFFMSSGTLWPNINGNPSPVEIPAEGLFDVDTEEDFLVVSNMIRLKKESKH